jgi:MerR family transcriptional regulator, light-induced transcriptional regulator
MPYLGHDDETAPPRGAVAVPGGLHVQVLAQTIERRLIPALARKHRRTATTPGALAAPATVTEADLALFVDELLRDDEAALRQRVAALLERGVAARELCLDLLAAAARRLGSLWEDDRCDFVQVTLGVGHLHGLLRGLGPRLAGGSAVAAGAAAGRRVLLAHLPQEQHVFGLSMLAHFFQAEGWAVGSATGTAGGAAAWVRAQHVDVVAFTIGGEALAEPLRHEIAAVRAASRNPALVVLVGGPLVVLHPQWAAELGADASPQHAHSVPAHAQRLVTPTVRR